MKGYEIAGIFGAIAVMVGMFLFYNAISANGPSASVAPDISTYYPSIAMFTFGVITSILSIIVAIKDNKKVVVDNTAEQ